MKKIVLILMKTLLLILVLWVIIAQTCFYFRKEDNDAMADFKKSGVVLRASVLTINIHHIHYVSTGNDSLPKIVFIHGSPGNWTDFEDYLRDKQLLKKFNLISIDRPGFGYSDFGNARHLDEQAKEISVLLQHIKNNKPLYVVGHSFGGPVAVALAYYNPGLVNGLITLAGCVDPDGEKKELLRSVLIKKPWRYAVPGVLRPSNDELIYFKQDVLQMPKMLSNIKCKVILFQGDHDVIVPYQNAVYAKSKLINAASVKLITLKGANHSIPWTHFQDIKKELLQL